MILTAIVLTWAFSGSEYATIEKQWTSGEKVIIGTLSSGSQLEQAIHIPKHPDLDSLYLGIRFATYGRTNLGQVILLLEQDTHLQSHTVNAGHLKDNELRYFPFAGFNPGLAKLRLQTLGGTPEQSPTVWGRYSPNEEPLRMNGVTSDKRIDIVFARKHANHLSIQDQLGSNGWVLLGLLSCATLSLVSYITLTLSKKTSTEGSTTFTSEQDPLLRNVSIALGAGLFISILVALFAKPVPEYYHLMDAYTGNREHAPPISKGIVVTQAIEITPTMAEQGFGLGILFGTFHRNNQAKIELSLEQSGNVKTHTFGSRKLIDNQPKIFPFYGFDPGSATLTIKGLDGKGSNSPTVWLDATSMPPFATIAGNSSTEKLIVYHYKIINQNDRLKKRMQSFPSSWLFTVSMIVFFTLQWIPHKNTSRRTP